MREAYKRCPNTFIISNLFIYATCLILIIFLFVFDLPYYFMLIVIYNYLYRVSAVDTFALAVYCFCAVAYPSIPSIFYYLSCLDIFDSYGYSPWICVFHLDCKFRYLLNCCFSPYSIILSLATTFFYFSVICFIVFLLLIWDYEILENVLSVWFFIFLYFRFYFSRPFEQIFLLVKLEFFLGFHNFK